MTEREFQDKLDWCKSILTRQGDVIGPGSCAVYLYGPNGEAQDRGEYLAIGYWQGNQDAKVFIKRGTYARLPNRFTDQERWLFCVEEALRADFKDGK